MNLPDINPCWMKLCTCNSSIPPSGRTAAPVEILVIFSEF
jgi:hypothetical protein